MQLNLFAETFAICKLTDDAPLDKWLAAAGDLPMITALRDGHGKTVVCPLEFASQSPRLEQVQCQTEWRCFQIAGVLDFSEIGIIAHFSSLLEASEISLYAVSSFETDYLLVMSQYVEQAAKAFEDHGHRVLRCCPTS